VAPALTSRGANAAGLTGESGFAGVNGTGLPGGAPNVLIANFPGVQNVPGASCTATACSLGANVTGILLTGGNGTLQPQTGQAYSFGLDLTPSMVPGLRLAFTYWVNKLRGGITAPQTALALGAADLSYLLQIYPSGATAAQIAAASSGLPQQGALNANTYFIYNFQQRNVLNLDVAGIDASANYSATTEYGRFNLGAGLTRKTRFDQFFGTTGQKFSVLGTAGFNTTFPSVKFEGRFNVGWELGGLEVNTYFNYLGSYRNWSGTAANPVTRANGVPTGGGDRVAAFKTMDLNVSYKLKDLGFLSEASVFVDTTNLFDRDPPFYNTYALNGASGYDPINASPIGRIITLGVRTKF
jgi:iron complex outermembrane receptor protein